MTDAIEAQESLEGVLKDEIIRMYQEVADDPGGEFHFYHGRQAAELFGYDEEWLNRAPRGAVESFAGVGNPHERSELQPGETVLDLGSGAGLDAIISSWRVGESGKVIVSPSRASLARYSERLGKLAERRTPDPED